MTRSKQRRITSDVSVRTGEQSCKGKALLDTGADDTVLSYDFARTLGLDLTDTMALDERPRVIDGRELQCYGPFELDLCLTDSLGRKYTCRHPVVVTKMEGIDLIMGLDWMRQYRPLIDFGSVQWRWPFDSTDIQLCSAKAFSRKLKDAPVLYALVIRPVTDDPDAETFTLPYQYKSFADVFSEKDAGVLPTGEHQHHPIVLENGKEPPYGPLYSLSSVELKTLRGYLDDGLQKGWIRHSTSPAGAPILFVPKKDGGLRLCVDYRGLNAITIKNRHPLPLISETLDRLVGAKYFTKLDLKDAYHRVRIKEGDEWKTAFRTRYGHFEYLVMPFGLANAPATFQAYINRALGGLLDHSCVVYLDDILIYSDNEEEHERHVREVLERLRRHGLYAKLNKCVFHAHEVEFLGFIVSSDGIAMDHRRVSTIKEWPTPKSFRDIQVFLGFANFYRRFIYRYSKIVAPLTDMLKGMEKGKKQGEFEWGDAQEHAFHLLCDAFTSAPILRHYDPDLPIRIETDASGSAIAANMFQPAALESGDRATSKHWHPVAFYSRKMTGQEGRYEVHDQELLAVVACFKEWRHYLEGSRYPVAVITDHNNLRYFMTTKELTRRQARWALKLAEFDFTIYYRAGKLNSADAPSRRPDYENASVAVNDVLPTLQHKLQNVSELKHFARLTLDLSEIEDIPPDQRSRSTTADQGIQIKGRARNERLRQSVGIVEDSLKRLLNEASRFSENEIYVAQDNDDVPPVQHHSGSESMGPRGLREPSTGQESPGDNGEMPASNDRRNVVQKALNPVAGTVGCKQLVPRLLATHVGARETVYERPTGDLMEIIAVLQGRDAFTQRKLRELIAPEERRSTAGTIWSEKDDLLYRDNALFVPDDTATKAEIIRRHHDDLMAGHFGVRKTSELIARKYGWDGLEATIKTYVETCEVCQRTKAPRHRPYGELQSLPRPERPWCEVSMDFITDLPVCRQGNDEYDSILVVVDRYTKMAKYLPTRKTIDAPALASLLFDRVVTQYGIPDGIVSDRGSIFTSHFWSAFCFHAKVSRRLSTAFHPQTDGQTERQNQTLEQYLRCFCAYKQHDWSHLLPLAEFAYNNSEHSVTKISPFFACMGFNPRLSFDIEANATKGEIPAAKQRAEQLQRDRKTLDERWERAIKWQANAYNKRHKSQSFRVGDQVLLSTKNLRLVRPNRKLMERYIGPFPVKDIKGMQAYTLDLPSNYMIHPTFHVSLLEPYHRRLDDVCEYPETGPVTVEGEEEYEVDEVLDERKVRGKPQYRIRWKGWSSAHDSWEPKDNLDHASEALQDYKSKMGDGIPLVKRRGRPPKKGRPTNQ